MAVNVPEALRRQWASSEPGRAWLARLPDIVDRCAARWELRLGAPYPGHVGLAVRARGPRDELLVLKVNFPDLESECEGSALAFWGGIGAVRLVEEAPDDRALLLERCTPGATLQSTMSEVDAFAVSADVLRGLWRPAPSHHPFRTLADAAAAWAVDIPARWQSLGRPFERSLLAAACDTYIELGCGQGESVVLHQDLHGCNILDAGTGRWLAIDPKPLVGEREFDTCAVLRERLPDLLAASDPVVHARRRLDALNDQLGLDRERMRRWTVAHTLAWSFEPGRVLTDMVDGARAFEAAGP